MKGKMVSIGLFLVIILLNLIYLVSSSTYDFSSSNGIIAWINDTGSLNITEDFLCDGCINTEDVNDIDDSDIEGDINTYVDIAGDTMSGPLDMGTNNINNIKSLYSNWGVFDIQATYNGATELRIDPIPSDKTSNSNIRLFRETNTTGSVYFILYVGNGTSTNHWKVNAQTGDMTIDGKIDFGGYCMYDNGTHLIEESC